MEHNQNGFARLGSSGADRASSAQPDRTAGAAGNAAAFALTAIPAPPTPRLDFDPVDLRARGDGWTREKQRWFIEELADCGIVREAAARVGMSEQSAYGLRRRADAASFNI